MAPGDELSDEPRTAGGTGTATSRASRLPTGTVTCSLEAAMTLGDRAEAAIESQGAAMATACLVRHEGALRLAGAAEAELDSLAIEISGIVFWAALLERYLGPAAVALGTEAAEAARADGRRRGFEWAVRERLSPA